MVDRQKLLADLKPLLRELEADLRARCDDVAEIGQLLTKEYNEARAANRAGVTFEEWRADLITQVGVAWVLSSVFVRFLEDNELISPPRISGPLHGAGDGQGMMRARDERDVFFKAHPKQTDRDYLLAVFDDLAGLPGTKDVFGPHNPVSAYRNWLSGDAARELIEFFQKIDADGTGEIIHDFTDNQWDTRFLGDLYQDLSEAARKKYALLQTPIFVEEFILERTLEPAIQEFGLKGLKMIDPACGSGHFLLGSFASILNHWRKAEPGTNDRELVNRSLASVHGVDLNPYAVAIARFRLLLAAMRECQVTRLKDAPDFHFNLACGDSLLHGAPGAEQQVLGFHELAHHYQSEDIDELRRILKPGQYHAVVANPPYITVKDKDLNEAYREWYRDVCHMKYSLSVPFIQRLLVLACDGGFTGQITANSFMKREFGKKLVESYLPKTDLTHVIDSSGAFIPGHNGQKGGTPTTILFGRNRPPVAPTIRTIMGIRGEPGVPQDPACGLVWSAITAQIDHAGSQSAFVSANDTSREQFGKHPWSIGGGGAAELKEQLDNSASEQLQKRIESIGFMAITGEDDVFVFPVDAARRFSIPARPFGIGDAIRDWAAVSQHMVFFPYRQESKLPCAPLRSLAGGEQFLWPCRTGLRARSMFNKTMEEHGFTWYEYIQFIRDRAEVVLSIVFAEVATHNHFVLDRGGKVFKQTAPVIKLPATATEDDHLALLGLLNSSTALFWLRQTCFPKGGFASGKWEERLALNGTNVEQFPLPAARPLILVRLLDELAGHRGGFLPAAVLKLGVPTPKALEMARAGADDALGRMIAAQEELDWQCYHLYGLIDEDLCYAYGVIPAICLGQRAFEIVLARKLAAGEEETSWFTRHGSTPITELPAEWPEDYKKIVQRRIDLIESGRNIGLIERPEYKRRWNAEPWEEQEERALRNWLLARLESYFDIDGRMNPSTSSGQADSAGSPQATKQPTARGELHQPRLNSIAKVADLAKQDKDFMQVAELYAGRMDFDVANLVGELVAAESVPALPVLRYKPTGLDKRAAWERTWELQRLEDAVDALFDVERLKKPEVGKGEQTLPQLVAGLEIDEKVKPQIIREVVAAGGYVAQAVQQKLNLDSDLVAKPVTDAAKRAKQAAVGDIPVPSKYTSADFLASSFWKLRGKLDVPKERWVSFPQCEGEDGTLVIAWAGYDHLQLARAIAERYEHAKEQEGRKLVPLLAAIGQLIPWLKQWHNDLDPTYGTRMGDYFDNYLAEESKALGMTVAEVMAWQPAARPRRTRRLRTAAD
jgi:hypothetical protein